MPLQGTACNTPHVQHDHTLKFHIFTSVRPGCWRRPQYSLTHWVLLCWLIRCRITIDCNHKLSKLRSHLSSEINRRCRSHLDQATCVRDHEEQRVMLSDARWKTCAKLLKDASPNDVDGQP